MATSVANPTLIKLAAVFRPLFSRSKNTGKAELERAIVVFMFLMLSVIDTIAPIARECLTTLNAILNVVINAAGIGIIYSSQNLVNSSLSAHMPCLMAIANSIMSRFLISC
ncbi:membrane protein [Candidatus Magnetobacterium bavaricum]|uniref:Membrane protein n=1 Tax=Candidatus Magnetobacterium bavaricum TaxID=29290 RepID=A0A0F3GTZ3_9BACT|nr:membrane protein [Candidatus Magnetobacterium bavaricum]